MGVGLTLVVATYATNVVYMHREQSLGYLTQMHSSLQLLVQTRVPGTNKGHSVSFLMFIYKNANQNLFFEKII